MLGNLDNSSAWLEPSGSNGSYSRRLALLPLSLHRPVSSHQQHLTSLRMPPPPTTFTASSISHPQVTVRTPTQVPRSPSPGLALQLPTRKKMVPVPSPSISAHLTAGVSRTVLTTRPHLPRLSVQSTSGMAIYLP
ncbi:hypothetical protein B0T18DRAFT_75164 [Schizothecium vesticola]|uniref:Uncharacterized protein n=1 Tax=Schizothecium vesticola TaxID=314040 RepID=A0AA40KAG2_9PEZI|nr:hypothetical protein B0T18DRAFT_75164 [Schizothecium vesticola]